MAFGREYRFRVGRLVAVPSGHDSAFSLCLSLRGDLLRDECLIQVQRIEHHECVVPLFEGLADVVPAHRSVAVRKHAHTPGRHPWVSLPYRDAVHAGLQRDVLVVPVVVGCAVGEHDGFHHSRGDIGVFVVVYVNVLLRSALAQHGVCVVLPEDVEAGLEVQMIVVEAFPVRDVVFRCIVFHLAVHHGDSVAVRHRLQTCGFYPLGVHFAEEQPDFHRRVPAWRCGEVFFRVWHIGFTEPWFHYVGSHMHVVVAFFIVHCRRAFRALGRLDLEERHRPVVLLWHAVETCHGRVLCDEQRRPVVPQVDDMPARFLCGDFQLHRS